MTKRLVDARRKLAVFIEQRCRLLGLQSTCPYVMSDAEGGIEFAAHLPQFGGAHGVLVDVVAEPDYVPSERHRHAAERIGIAVSFINPESLLSAAEEFIEALRDWGYRGRLDDLPTGVAELILPPKK